MAKMEKTRQERADKGLTFFGRRDTILIVGQAIIIHSLAFT
jgi:hypothetical protein